MPDDDKVKISELTAALTLNNTDDLVIDQGPEGSKVTKRTSVAVLGSHIAEDMEFSSELQTASKKIIGAINELASKNTIKANATKIVPPSVVASFVGMAFPLKSISVEVNASQESGTPTPQAPKSIIGVSSVKLSNYGKGFLPNMYIYENWKADLVSVGDQKTTSSTRGFPLPVVSGKTYTISFGLDASNIPTYLYLCKSDLTTSSERIAYITNGSSIMNRKFTFTADGNLFYLKMSALTTDILFKDKIKKIDFAILEEGTIETLPTGRDYTIDLEEEYYGGVLSVVNGDAAFDQNKKSKNLSELSWSYSNGVFSASISDGQTINENNIIDYMCDTYAVLGSQSSTAYSSSNYVLWHGKSSSKNWVFVRDSRYSTAETFAANVTGKIVYVSTSSSIIPLAPINIEANEGDNNFKDSNLNLLSIEYFISVEEAIEKSAGNVLLGKKWAVCGDSFTNGATDTLIGEGKYYDKKAVYPYLIANRNNMEIYKFFEGGRTLAFPSTPGDFTNSLTNPSNAAYYQNIPSDADYITIYLGINDYHHATTGEIIPIGTTSDNTTATYLGAFNVVLSWLMANRPKAHIGLIITNGIEDDDNYRLGQIDIAKKFGLPYIDLNGDQRTAAMIRTSNPDIDASVKQILLEKWRVSSSNPHPNDEAHIFEANMIEAFLRSI